MNRESEAMIKCVRRDPSLLDTVLCMIEDKWLIPNENGNYKVGAFLALAENLKEWIEEVTNPAWWHEDCLDMPQWALSMLHEIGSRWRIEYIVVSGHLFTEAIKRMEEQ